LINSLYLYFIHLFLTPLQNSTIFILNSSVSLFCIYGLIQSQIIISLKN
jgi:hypothetical protein